MNYPSKDFTIHNLKGWLKCGREDLKSIPMMIKEGYTVKFDYRDINAKRITPDNVPMWAVSFNKGDFNTWKGYKSVPSKTEDSRFRDLETCWISATLDNGYYVGHVRFPYLSMVVKYEKTLVTV